MEEDCDYYFKVILLGFQSVGKTAIVQRFCYECYEEESLKTTLGFDFLTKVFKHKGKRIQMQIWDTAGQERFRAVTKMYYQDVNGVILVYDVTSKDSLAKLQFWFDDLEMNGDKTEKRILVGNKLDLVKERKVQPFEGKKLATEQDMDWLECSAKTGEHVTEVFERLADKMIAASNTPVENGSALSSKGNKLNNVPHSSSKKGCC